MLAVHRQQHQIYGGVLEKQPQFVRRNILNPGLIRTPNLRIHTECFDRLGYTDHKILYYVLEY